MEVNEEVDEGVEVQSEEGEGEAAGLNTFSSVEYAAGRVLSIAFVGGPQDLEVDSFGFAILGSSFIAVGTTEGWLRRSSGTRLAECGWLSERKGL